MAETIRSDGGNVAGVQEIDALARIAPRRAGSEPERRAAGHLQRRLEEIGREAHIEPTRVRPAFAAAHLIHAVVGIVGSVISVYIPGIGLLLTAAATISAFGELTGTFSLARSLMPLRASQNVVSDEDEGKPGVIVLVAHYDAPATGSLYNRRLASWPRALFYSLALVTICAVGRLIGLSGTPFTIIQFIPTVVLIAMTPLFADAAIGATSNGVRDNAAGVATVLQLAATYSKRLRYFDLMVVFTGASAHFGLGMRPWLKRHRGELDPTATAVIVLDNLGDGEARYAPKEGVVFATRMHPMLVEIARDLGEPINSRDVSDAYIARGAGLPALRLTSGGSDPDERPDPDGLKSAHDLAAAIIEHIDQEIGPQVG